MDILPIKKIQRISHKGFTIIELLVVMGIISALLGISFAGLNAIRQSQYVVIQTQNVLESLKRARSLAINAQNQDANSPWYYGFVFFLNNQGTNRGYCIDKWFATGPNTDPTQIGFVPPPTLSQQVYDGTFPSIDTTKIQCSGYANTTGAGGFAVVDDKIYDSQVNNILYTYSNPNVKFIVFENLTGNTFLFDNSGAYINSGNTTITLQLQNTTAPVTTKTIVIKTPNNEAPYIQ